ncbi:MAG TPA: hypothetical protein VFM24_08615 [Nitrospira sp.]|nr:hypothetical protein [Nitrospira sp.]
MKAIVVTLTLWWVAACGTVGAPIAPEDVGVAPVIERQKKADADAANREDAGATPVVVEPQGQDLDLPPLRPVGTR